MNYPCTPARPSTRMAPAIGLPATDAAGKPIAALQTGVEHQLRLSFTQDALNIRGGCNAQFGGYTYKNGVLNVANLASTMKACEQSLMRLDAEIGQRMKGELRATLSGEAAEPGLELVAQDASIKRPNPGLDVVQLTYTYQF